MTEPKLNVSVEELASFLAGGITDMSSGGHFARYQRALPLARRMLAAEKLYEALRRGLHHVETHLGGWEGEVVKGEILSALALADGKEEWIPCEMCSGIDSETCPRCGGSGRQLSMEAEA